MVCASVLSSTLWRTVANAPDLDLKHLALNSLATSAHLRERRHLIGAMRNLTTELPPLPHRIVTNGTKQRVIFSADGLTIAGGRLVRIEGDTAIGDLAADEVYDAVGHFLNLLAHFERKSLDNNWLPLVSTVHYGTAYSNAYWDGIQIVCGDGDNIIFSRFTQATDIIAHELAHGLIQHTAGLVQWDQPGALNESFADCFGIMTRQLALKQTVADCSWLIGPNVLMPRVSGLGLRSMKSPGTAYNDPIIGVDPQPDHVDKYVTIDDDDGGVHVNSGIPNRAFCLACQAVGGYSWETIGLVWYETLLKKLRPRATFQRVANATTLTARERFGAGSRVEQAVIDAWRQVGLTPIT